MDINEGPVVIGYDGGPGAADDLALGIGWAGQLGSDLIEDDLSLLGQAGLVGPIRQVGASIDQFEGAIANRDGKGQISEPRRSTKPTKGSKKR